MEGEIDGAIAYCLDKLGYDAIRPHQEKIMKEMLSNNDCLLVASTGSGKSFIFEGITFAMDYIKKQKKDASSFTNNSCCKLGRDRHKHSFYSFTGICFS